MENNTSKLEVSEQFQCSKEKLFTVWTDPEQLKQWWKPMGKQLTEVKNNLVEGGEVRYVFGESGLTIDGTYNKVTAHDLLEYSWNWHLAGEPAEESKYKLTVDFSGDDSNATIAITQDGFAKEESIKPHKEGWEKALQQLKEFVGKNSIQQEPSDKSPQKPPISGYNETPEQLKVGGG